MKRHMIVIGFFMFFTSTVFSQNVGTTSQPIIVEKKVGIKNLGPTQIAFWIRKRGEDWVKHSLNPNQIDAFACGEQCLVYVSTKGKQPIQRRLIQTKRYGIFWDRDKRLWDIGEATG